MVDQVKTAYIPMGIEHDPRIPPLGRVITAEITHLPDGEYALDAKVEVFEEGDVVPLTGVRRIVAVTTHGSSKLINALEGEGGKRTLFRSIRLLCSKRTRTTWCALYGLDRATAEQRAAFLDRVERTLAKLH